MPLVDFMTGVWHDAEGHYQVANPLTYLHMAYDWNRPNTSIKALASAADDRVAIKSKYLEIATAKHEKVLNPANPVGSGVNPPQVMSGGRKSCKSPAETPKFHFNPVKAAKAAKKVR